MKKAPKIIHDISTFIAVIIASLTLLSVFTNTDSRFLKMLDFTRIQFFIISVISLVLFLVFAKKYKSYDYLIVIGLVGGMLVNAYYLVNYTPLVTATVASVERVDKEDAKVSILIANVKMKNRKAQPFIDLINNKAPDIVLGMETDAWWEKQLSSIKKDYPYRKEVINEVAYGMIVYSKLPLEKVKVNYLNNENVPSIEGVLSMKSGKQVSLFCVHPVPPTHYEKLPDNEGQKEVEILKIGEKVKKSPFPSIVIGDINDVVWSNTDRLTGTNNLLHDVRVGRGFYNTFKAGNPFLSWPLDHVFVTEEFKLKNIERLENIESDHFPLYVELVL